MTPAAASSAAACAAEIAAVEHAHPDDWRAIRTMLDGLPAFVAAGDASGDLPAGVLDLASVRLLNRMNLPLQYGGLEATATARRRVLVCEMVGRVCAVLPMAMPGLGLAMPPILALGTDAQKAAIFGAFVASETPRFGAFAITEPHGGSDPVAMRTTATRDGDGYILNGEKCFITGGARADLVVVFATIAPDKGRFGIRAFAVERGTPGFTVERSEDMLGLRAGGLATLVFQDCRLPASAMLGHNGKRGPLIDAFTGAQSAWDYMRPAIASSINGACLGVLDHVEQRLTAGALALTAARAAELRGNVAKFRARAVAGRLVALDAAATYDRDGRGTLDASLAKAYSSTLAMELAAYLAAALPAAAVTKGDRIEKFYRDAKGFDILEGTGDMQRLIVARAFQPTVH